MNKTHRKLNIQERIFKWLFRTGDTYKLFINQLSGLCRFIITVTLSLFVLGLVFYVGFGISPENLAGLRSAFRIIFVVIFLTKYIPEILKYQWKKEISHVFRIMLFLFSLMVFLSNFGLINSGKPFPRLFLGNGPIVLAIIFMGISEVSGLLWLISSIKIPPALIFSLSFLVIIFIGSGLLMIFLMWIGASPGSTGGGIKTTTFALAFRTAWNNIRGRERIKIGNREISNSTVSRVLSIIILSFMIIGTGFFCLLLTEKGQNPAYLLFECFSAYGTVGLSIADSGTFSSAGKIVDIILMFIGRVGPLTLFTGLLVSSRKFYTKYPEVDIVIN